MLAYYKHHPGARGGLVKKATSSALARFFLGFRKQIPSMKNLDTQARQFARKNAIGLSGVAAGTIGGAWLGNKAYNNAIPPVRMLPGVEQQPQIGVWQSDQNWQRLGEYADY